jgi:hypothetical protein
VWASDLNGRFSYFIRERDNQFETIGAKNPED